MSKQEQPREGFTKGRSKISYDQLAKAIDIYAGLKFGGSHCELADSMGIARSTVSRLRNMREDTCITRTLANQFQEVLDYCQVVPHQVYSFGYSINGEEFKAEIVFNTQLGKSTTRYFADGKPVKNVKKWDELMEAAKGKILFGPYNDQGDLVAKDVAQASRYHRIRGHKKTSHLYLMKDARNGRIKIGISQNPKVREKTLQSEVPAVSIIYSTKSAIGKDICTCYKQSERFLHDHFHAKRCRGEWFELSQEDVCLIKEFCKEVDQAKTKNLSKVLNSVKTKSNQTQTEKTR